MDVMLPAILCLTCLCLLACAGDDWQRQALSGIEAHRKADFVIRVVDEANRPVPDAEVDIAMFRHAFTFGTAVNEPGLLRGATETDDPYGREIRRLFNSGTLENFHKWRYQETPEKQRQADEVVAWLVANGLRVRGHTLIWTTFKYGAMPKDVHQALEADDAAKFPEVRQRALEHVRAVVKRYAGVVAVWDVVNENVVEHELVKRLTPGVAHAESPLLAEWFEAAHAEGPQTHLVLNDFNLLVGDFKDHKDDFERAARYLLKHQAPLHGLGMQSHFHNSELRRSPQQLRATLDRFAELGLSISITEFDMFGKGWGETPAAREAVQAEVLREFFMVCFSHPAVDGITMWGFWDGAHWGNEAPLFRKDWTPKPALAVYESLVLDQWRTRLTARSDAKGEIRFRGFKGDYRLVVQGLDGTTTLAIEAHLVANGDSAQVLVMSPTGK